MLVNALLGRGHIDKFAQLAAQVRLPAEIDVPIQAHRLILRENEIFPNAAIQAVRESKIDDAIGSPERHRGLSPIPG
jgi:hypothetical protein